IGDAMFVLSHRDAPHFKVLRIDRAKPDIASAAPAIPESENVITGLAAARDALYARRMNGGISNLVRVNYAAGAKPLQVKLPFAGDIEALAADPRLSGVVFQSGSWTQSDAWYEYDPKRGTVIDTKLQPRGKYDKPADLTSTEVK